MLEGLLNPRGWVAVCAQPEPPALGLALGFVPAAEHAAQPTMRAGWCC